MGLKGVKIIRLVFVKTVLVSTISNSQVFLLKKCEATHIFFRKNINVYAIVNDQSFKDMLTYDIISFEQLGPIFFFFFADLYLRPNPSAKYQSPSEVSCTQDKV